MSYTDKAKEIRGRLAKYEKNSVLQHILNYLHAPEDNGYETAKKMPYIAFLLIEWLYQVEEDESPKLAEKCDVDRLLRSTYGLQTDAAEFRDHVHHELVLRKVSIAQLWYQQKNYIVGLL